MNTRLHFFIGLTTQQGDLLLPGWVADKVVAPLLADYGVDGFTMTNGWGYWKGKSEASLIVTVYCNTIDPVNAGAEVLAKEFATNCAQECVLWSREPVHAGFSMGEHEGNLGRGH